MPDLYYDGAKVSPESPIGKELMKFEKPYNWRPEEHPFPKMLYKATHRPDGKRSVGEILDHVCGDYPGAAVEFTRRCQHTVYNEAELNAMLSRGWRKTQEEALALLEAEDDAVSTGAAERAAADLRMSEKAQREAEAADAKTLKHLPEIPEKPVVRRVKKSAAAA